MWTILKLLREIQPNYWGDISPHPPPLFRHPCLQDMFHFSIEYVIIIGGHGTLQKYRGTGIRYFAKISTAVPEPVLSN